MSNDTSLRNKIKKIVALLENHYEVQKWTGKGNPLSSLILTILSQNTNDLNRDNAYRNLRNTLPNWEDVAAVSEKEIASLIQVGGLSKQKARTIKTTLKWIQNEYGSLDLTFMHTTDSEILINLFTRIKGIGIKTISVVLMFACGVDIFPVDTHVHRICIRLGLVQNKFSPEKVFWKMRPFVPKGKAYGFHMNLIRHGREICKARSPSCDKCFLNSSCQYAKYEK